MQAIWSLSIRYSKEISRFSYATTFYLVTIFLPMSSLLAINFTCPASLQTKQIVQFCPKNKTDLEIAAQRKKCNNIDQKCLDKELQYHCVMNSERTHAVEVCYPDILITGGHCSEYNEDGMRVMPNLSINCKNHTKKCPEVYNSSDAYKYTGCYTNSTKDLPVNADGNTDGLPVSVIGIIIIIAVIIIGIIIGVIAIKVRRHRKKLKKEKEKQEKEMQILGGKKWTWRNLSD